MKRYYITDRKAVGGFNPLLDIIEDQIHLGVDYIQIREKDVTARELWEFTVAALQKRHTTSGKPLPTKILINTRADVALAAGADGVHLPSSAPQQVPGGLLVARSCHTLEDVRNSTADFVTFGPVFPSPGKGIATGVSLLEAACATGKVVYALGGVTWENAADCMRAGVVGVAGIRLFQDPEI